MGHLHGESVSIAFFECSTVFGFLQAFYFIDLVVQILVALVRDVFNLLNLLVLGFLLEQVALTGSWNFVTIWDRIRFNGKHVCLRVVKFGDAHLALVRELGFGAGLG